MAAACDKRAHTARQCWSTTFPDDLLAFVYTKVASPRGRARFAAVCQSWRAAARAAPPVPALPWLLLLPRDHNRRKALHCLEDSSLVRLWVLRKDAGRRIIGGHDGGWVAMPVPGLIKIVNLFSGAEVPLPKKNAPILCMSQHHGTTRMVPILRVIFSAPPTSARCIIAGITYKCGIALCRVGCPNSGWTVRGCPNYMRFVDIAFCNDELYGIHCDMTVVKFQIVMNDDGAPIITAERRLVMQWIDRVGDYLSSTSYIFDLHGKLGMAMKTRWSPNMPPFFKVFKLVDIDAGGQKELYLHEWLEITSLGDHSLFLGETFSKAVHVPTNMCGGVERNCIYYSHCCPLGQDAIIPGDKVSVTILNNFTGEAFYKEDDSKNDITSNGPKKIGSIGYFMKGHSHGGMWILPPYI